MKKRNKVIILDTSAFIAGFDPMNTNLPIYSVPAVGNELTEGSLPKIRFDASVQKRKINIMQPDVIFIEMVKEISEEIGDLTHLSDSDVQILALAAKLKSDGYLPTIITDDYSIQNVARQMGICFEPLLTFGIRFHFKWLLYCPGCRKKYQPDYRKPVCEICGTQLKRKPLQKTLLQRRME
ncbi:MAG: hypothetical protein RMJ07_02365 [Nitrososphaerota archaeon]|nr:hypothetical protein [Candidatus Bathyarchaeota archaeon]MDW8048513.1 hypothetical protein [Nitrososphaerota archaeon]